MTLLRISYCITALMELTLVLVTISYATTLTFSFVIAEYFRFYTAGITTGLKTALSLEAFWNITTNIGLHLMFSALRHVKFVAALAVHSLAAQFYVCPVSGRAAEMDCAFNAADFVHFSSTRVTTLSVVLVLFARLFVV